MVLIFHPTTHFCPIVKHYVPPTIDTPELIRAEREHKESRIVLDIHKTDSFFCTASNI